MNVAALIAWLVTALGGFYLLGKWLAGGGARQQHGGPSRFPVPVIFGHFLLAAAGLIVWIIFLLAHTKALAWTAFVILVPVALLGFTMFFRWIGVHPESPGGRGTAAPVPAPARVGAPAAAGAPAAPAPAAAGAAVPAERHLPVPVVLAHGALAATTLVLVLLAALGA
jgi:hypothetical protein